MGQGSSIEQLEEQHSNIMLAIRMMKKQSDKGHKQQKQYVEKARQALNKGEHEIAKMYANQSIQHKHQSLRYLNMSLRMEVVASMAQSAINTGEMTESISKVIGLVNNISRPEIIMSSINTFERVFDDLSITIESVGNTLDATAGLTKHTSEADTLLESLKEEQAINKFGTLPSTNGKLNSLSEFDDKIRLT